jgi:hypothetical protein
MSITVMKIRVCASVLGINLLAATANFERKLEIKSMGTTPVRAAGEISVDCLEQSARHDNEMKELGRNSRRIFR